ncbi:hypothetical protein [Selenomonas ruminantium]|uniref:ComK protein n=1 Tax=Selenomonas ruminantium TaxID=971 RepID=A0A1K1N5L1_SELRU|nr:hypothetical protein [Selenomonas ruminantium]SFW30635.1 hypothetical protein SAMN02910323_1190 [Selenomonas ruminantium]
MNEELRQNLCSGLAIEALYEKETGQGDFATCVIRGNGTVEIYPHCKVETALDMLAASRGMELSRLRRLRGRARGNLRSHVDFYEISLWLLFMPVRYCKPFNSNHGAMVYVNVPRLRGVMEDGQGHTILQFFSGQELRVKESAATLRGKMTAGRELYYGRYIAQREDLRYVRLAIKRLQRLVEACL